MKDVFRVDGKIAVITGGSSGIGKGAALSLARQGADILFIGRNPEKIKAAEAEIKAYGTRVKGVRVDISDSAAVRAFFKNEVPAFGGMDIYVNNAGINIRKTVMNVEDWELDELLATNFKGTVYALRSACQFFAKEEKEERSIVFVTSINAMRSLPSQSIYSATKAAVQSLVESTAVEMGKYGVRVNCVAPGGVKTDMNVAIRKPTDYREITPGSKSPIPRMGEIDDLGDVIAFLVSDAARYVTGCTVVVDGGSILRK